MSSRDDKPAEGWWKPYTAKKWHFMRGNRSLCGGWESLSISGYQPDTGRYTSDCVKCRRLLDRESTAEPEPPPSGWKINNPRWSKGKGEYLVRDED